MGDPKHMRKILLAIGIAALVLGISLVSTSLYDAGEKNVIFYSQTMHLGTHGEYYSDLLNMTEAHQLGVSPGPGTTTVYIIPSDDLSLVNQSNARSYAYTSMTGTPGGTDGLSLSGKFYIVVFSPSIPPISYYVLGGPSFETIEVFLSTGILLAPVGAVTTILGTLLTSKAKTDGEQGGHTSIYGGYRWLAFSTLYIVTACYSFNVIWDFVLNPGPFLTHSILSSYILIFPVSMIILSIPEIWMLMEVRHEVFWIAIPLTLPFVLIVTFMDLFLLPALSMSFATLVAAYFTYDNYKKDRNRAPTMIT